jgi:selenocysteine lyase/cysteine desulfurase
VNDDWRDRFLTPPGGPYLLSHSVGPQPVAAAPLLHQTLLAPWAAKGGEAWGDWLAAIDRFRASLAGLLGGGPADYCPQANLSAGLTRLLTGLTVDPRRPVLLAAETSFPSLGFVLQQMTRLGYQLRWLPRAADVTDAGVWAAALTDDVAAVLTMHVHSNSGAVAPVTEIAALARARGIVSIVDVAQSAGILPIDVTAWGADAVLGSCVKWLCGGPGAGFLWVAPGLVEAVRPLDVGWFSHAEPFAFDIHDFRYAPDARRFWGGTPSVAPYVLATAGIETVAALGVQQILQHNRRLIARLRAAVPARWHDRLDVTARGGTLCLPLADDEAGLVGRLRAIGCRFDQRGAVLRLSFHAGNTDDEADRVADCFSA